jgi:cation diffusion facilitator CzcD-associated flavoprotein CzcO
MVKLLTVLGSTMPIHTPRPIRVIIIGAGPSGLLMAYKLRRNFVNLSWVIYEKNPEAGGTWHENKYPGCRCDNPAHTYVWVSNIELLSLRSMAEIAHYNCANVADF